MSAHQPKSVAISVIIPAFDRSEDLPRLFAALASQTVGRDKFEVIVCDDGSEPPLETIVMSLLREHGLEGKYVRSSHQGPGPARNAGLAVASGELLAFLDSDTVPEAEWLQAYQEAFRRDNLDLAGGLIVSAAAADVWSQAFNFLMSSSIGAAGARDPRAIFRQAYIPRTGNMAVRRTRALAVNGFCSASVAEDLDFSMRLLADGAKVGFVPGARVVHYERCNWCKIVRGCWRRGVARVRLQRRYKLREPRALLPACLVIIHLLILVIGMIKPHWWPVLITVPLTYLAALLGVGLYASWRLRRPVLLFIVPVCAATMHWCFGLGWLAAWLWPKSHRMDKFSNSHPNPT